MNPC
jgi:hypothetical protein